MNHAEITKVTRILSNGLLQLDEPTSREYDSTAELCDVNSIMCQNITVSGINFNGNVTGSVTPSQSFTVVGLADGVNFQNINGTGFMYTALDFVNTRNVLVNNSVLGGAAGQGARRRLRCNLQPLSVWRPRPTASRTDSDTVSS